MIPSRDLTYLLDHLTAGQIEMDAVRYAIACALVGAKVVTLGEWKFDRVATPGAHQLRFCRGDQPLFVTPIDTVPYLLAEFTIEYHRAVGAPSASGEPQRIDVALTPDELRHAMGALEVSMMHDTASPEDIQAYTVLKAAYQRPAVER